jgi:hypothetical protein
MQLSAHALWLVGFRPFFALACLCGAALAVLRDLLFTRAIAAPSTSYSQILRHAHERFFGLGWAVPGGLLLTAVCAHEVLRSRGLRSVARGAEEDVATRRGPRECDAAYHQGTVRV